MKQKSQEKAKEVAGRQKKKRGQTIRQSAGNVKEKREARNPTDNGVGSESESQGWEKVSSR